jgi:hypothetical protein
LSARKDIPVRYWRQSSTSTSQQDTIQTDTRSFDLIPFTRAQKYYRANYGEIIALDTQTRSFC